MSVRWVPPLAHTPPPSASILKEAMSAGAQQGTEEMGPTVSVRVCVPKRVGAGGPRRGAKRPGCGRQEKTGPNWGEMPVKTKGGGV